MLRSPGESPDNLTSLAEQVFLGLKEPLVGTEDVPGPWTIEDRRDHAHDRLCKPHGVIYATPNHDALPMLTIEHIQVAITRLGGTALSNCCVIYEEFPDDEMPGRPVLDFNGPVNFMSRVLEGITEATSTALQASHEHREAS